MMCTPDFHTQNLPCGTHLLNMHWYAMVLSPGRPLKYSCPACDSCLQVIVHSVPCLLILLCHAWASPNTVSAAAHLMRPSSAKTSLYTRLGPLAVLMICKTAAREHSAIRHCPVPMLHTQTASQSNRLRSGIPQGTRQVEAVWKQDVSLQALHYSPDPTSTKTKNPSNQGPAEAALSPLVFCSIPTRLTVSGHQ